MVISCSTAWVSDKGKSILAYMRVQSASGITSSTPSSGFKEFFRDNLNTQIGMIPPKKLRHFVRRSEPSTNLPHDTMYLAAQHSYIPSPCFNHASPSRRTPLQIGRQSC